MVENGFIKNLQLCYERFLANCSGQYISIFCLSYCDN